jgi:uncharacterized protein YecT (DUF1311 family)
MTARLFLMLFLACGHAFAATMDDRAIKETARKTYRSESDVRSALRECDKDQSTVNTCAEFAYVQVDQELNERYRAQLARVRGTSSEKPFVTAQKAWLQFRDLDCKYQASVIEGGTMHGQWVLDCMRQRAIERTKHIESFLNCNDNGCPGQ